MEKKEFLKGAKNNKAQGASIKPKAGGFSGWLFGVTKFLLGVLLLPYTYSSSVAFLGEFAFIDKACQNYFWAGAITLVSIYLFVWEPSVIYTKGQKILEAVFQFFTPLVRVAPYVVPIYTLVLVILYGLLSFFIKDRALLNYFLFFLGFTMSLHLIFGAKTLMAKQGDFLKANYMFGFSVVYIVNLAFLSFCLSLIFSDFSFVRFSNVTLSAGNDIIYAVFRQLFLR